MTAAAALAAPAGAPRDDRATLSAIAIAEDRRSDADSAIARGLRAAEAPVRARAALAAGRLQDSTWVPRLLPLTGDADDEARREAVFALGQIGHRSARERLERLCDHADLETGRLAVEALGKLGDKAATPRVARMLDHREGRMRGEAAVALWRLADSTALGALLAHHEDPDPEVHWRVMYALEKVVAPERVVLIAALHLDDPDWLTRAYAARTLGRQKSPRATAYLLQMLGDPEPAVIVNALRALQLVADSASAPCGPAIARALDHPHPYVRVTAATALADRFAWTAPDSAARERMLGALAAHLGDPDAATRGAAARALLERGAVARVDLAKALADSSLTARAAVVRALPLLGAREATPRLVARLSPHGALLERMNAAEALGELKDGTALPALRAGLADTSALFLAACAGALGELGDSASVPALVAAFERHARDADADARISLRDALRQLAGAAFADSLERAHPAAAAPAAYPPDFADPPAYRGAVLHTSAGDVEWAFFGAEAPQTVKNFCRLAARGYYDGTTFHRVVPNFVIQDGDPTGTGAGGPGYTIRCEYNRLRYEPGMVGMALSGKDTGGSQWFITHSPQMHLNGRYTIFARVVRGMEVVHRVVQGDRVLSVELLR